MKARKVKGLDPEGSFEENARRIVAVRLDELMTLGSTALEADAVKALHDTRIAAKRLRYVLELSGPALGRTAANGARTARRLQDVLGEIHDCDVMLPHVHDHIERLRAEDVDAVRSSADRRAGDLEPGATRNARNLKRYLGLEALASYLTARREILFQRFLRDWNGLEQRSFADRLLAGISPEPPAPGSRRDGAGP